MTQSNNVTTVVNVIQESRHFASKCVLNLVISMLDSRLDCPEKPGFPGVYAIWGATSKGVHAMRVLTRALKWPLTGG